MSLVRYYIDKTPLGLNPLGLNPLGQHPLEPFKCYVGGISFPEKKRFEGVRFNVNTLLALRGGGWGSKTRGKKRYVTLEWPLRTKPRARTKPLALFKTKVK